MDIPGEEEGRRREEGGGRECGKEMGDQERETENKGWGGKGNIY